MQRHVASASPREIPSFFAYFVYFAVKIPRLRFCPFSALYAFSAVK